MRVKILILSSQKTAIGWKKSCDSADFDKACRSVTDCNIGPVENKQSTNGRPVYISTGKSARQTAEHLFDNATIVEEKLLDEVPYRSYKDTGRKLPLWFWQLMARLQHFLDNGRQPETRAQTIDRAEKLIGLLEAQGQDCILVSYPAFLKVLLDRFRIHGYCATRSGVFRIAPLERILITKRDMHCGGCGHNCLLTNPGCGVGQDKARRHSG